MHLFQYTTKSAYIAQLKRVKDIEEELRKLHPLLDIYDFGGINKSLDQVINPFKLYTQCFELFESKSTRTLPDFLHSARKNSATDTLRYLVKTDYQLTYDEYVDIFKHLKVDLILPSSDESFNLGLEAGMKSLIYLTAVVKDKPNPYKLDYKKINAGSLYQTTMNRTKSSQQLLHALALRQNVFNDMQYTVLEDYISHYTAKVSQSNRVAPNATLEVQQLLNACIEFDKIVPPNAI